jgi:hypothetical protein
MVCRSQTYRPESLPVAVGAVNLPSTRSQNGPKATMDPRRSVGRSMQTLLPPKLEALNSEQEKKKLISLFFPPSLDHGRQLFLNLAPFSSFWRHFSNGLASSA